MDITLHNVGIGQIPQGYVNDYCWVSDDNPPNVSYTGSLSDTNLWYNNMDRGDDMFEVAMVLHHIEKAGNWVDSLGYMQWPLSNEVDVDPHAGRSNPSDTGAWYFVGGNQIYFGVGGVDAAEDQVAIWHEYGHHVSYCLHPNRNNLEEHVGDTPTASLMEGFADYFAASYKHTITGWDPYDMAEWGQAEFYIEHPEKRRRTDTDHSYPDNYDTTRTPHYNGQIFSSALMDVYNEIGRWYTDTILLESINDWGIQPTMPSAGENFINTAEDLYGKEYLCECISNFKAHGITQRSFSEEHRYVQDITIQSSITYNDACKFTFENVTIDNSTNIDVIVEPIDGETTITKSFEVKKGSTFEIR